MRWPVGDKVIRHVGPNALALTESASLQSSHQTNIKQNDWASLCSFSSSSKIRTQNGEGYLSHTCEQLTMKNGQHEMLHVHFVGKNINKY